MDNPSKRIFVGRKTEIEQFTQYIGRKPSGLKALFAAPGSGVKSRIFLPYGIGGIGKTELSKECVRVAQANAWKTIWIDWDTPDTRPVEPVQLMDSIVYALRKVCPQACKTYLKDRKGAQQNLKQINRYRIEHPEIWQKLLEKAQGFVKLATPAMPDPLTKAGLAALPVVMNYGPAILSKAQDLLVEHMEQQKLLQSEDVLLYRSTDARLAHELVDGLIQAAQEDSILFVLDTCESLSPQLEEFLSASILCRAVKDSNGLLFIVSGRINLSRERKLQDPDGRYRTVKGYADLLSDPPPVIWNLEQFADPDVADYLKERQVEPSAELVEYVQNITRGVPFAVQLLVDALLTLGGERVQREFPPQDPNDTDTTEIVEDVTRRFLRYCLNTEDESRVRTIAFLHTFDHALIARLWKLAEEKDARAVLYRLSMEYGFVRSNGSLHEIVRLYLRNEMRQLDPSLAHQFGQQVIDHYLPLFEAECSRYPTLEERVVEKRWETLVINLLNAYCWRSEDQAILFLVGSALEAWQFQASFVQTLLKITREFRDCPGWWSARTCRWYDALQRAALQTGDEQKTGWTALLADRNKIGLSSAQQCILKMQVASSWLEKGQPIEAFMLYGEAEALVGSDPGLRKALAEKYMELGNHIAYGMNQKNFLLIRKAQAAYEKSYELNPENYIAFLNLGVMFASSKDAGELCTSNEYFKKFHEAAPHCPTPMLYQGINGLQMENYQLAIQEFSAFLSEHQSLILVLDGYTYTDVSIVHFWRALAHKNNGDAASALEDFTKAVEILECNRDHPDPLLLTRYWQERGELNEQQKDYAQAVHDFSKAIQLNAKADLAYHQRAHAQEHLGDAAAALADFTSCIELAPTNASHYYCRGNFSYRRQRFEEALFDLDKSIELRPHESAAYLVRGAICMSLGKYELAIEDFNRVVAMNPADEYIYNNRGTLFAMLGNYRAAIDDFTRAIEQKPDTADLYFRRGEALATCGELERARADLNHAVDLNPSHPEVYLLRGQLQEDPLAALADYDRTIALEPQSANAYYLRAQVYKSLSNQEAALADINRAIALLPAQADFYLTRAWLHAQSTNLAAAFSDVQRAIELGTKNADAYYLRAQIHEQHLKNITAALADMNRAIELEPGLAAYHYVRARLYAAQQDLLTSLSDLNQAIELAPTQADFYFARAQVLMGQPNIEAALADMDQAIRLSADNALFYRWRGVISARLNRFASAQADLLHAIQIEPDRADGYYDMASVQALGGCAEQAVHFLRQAVNLSTHYVLQNIDTDQDLDPIREHPEFQRFIREIQAHGEQSAD